MNQPLKRTCCCSELKSMQGMNAVICGWIQEKKRKGSEEKIILRDASGFAEIEMEKNFAKNESKKIPVESAVSVSGTVCKKGGKIFLAGKRIDMLGKAENLPLKIGKEKNEEKRIKYRYLDLRSERMKRNILLQDRVRTIARNYLHRKGFIEIETPLLSAHVPEGSDDFIVSSKKNEKRRYVLPQSPQLYKQLLAIAGFEKYFQIAKCFRDDALMAVKQPEFTQLDIELGFAEEKKVFRLMEGLMKKLFKETLGEKINTPFKIMSYEKAMHDYGSDKPDTRFGLKLMDVSDELKGANFPEFKKILAKKGIIKAFKADCRKLSKKDFIDLHKTAKEFKAKELYLLQASEKGKLKGKIAGFLPEENAGKLLSRLNAKKNETIFITAGGFFPANNSLRKVRLLLGKKLGIIPENKWNFLWVDNFPFFEISDITEKMEFTHNPFVSPAKGHEEIIKNSPLKAKARTYDLVLNGFELGGGGVRNTDPKLLKEILKKSGYTEKQIKKQFGFFLNAMKFGAPPHAGIALGLERLAMLLAKEKTIREVIAFPKNREGLPLMEASM